MAADNRRTLFSNSISMSGLLSLTSGTGLLMAVRKYEQYSHQWGQLVKLLLTAIAVVLIVSGMRQTLAVVYPALSRQRLRQINRHRVLVPREGLMYLAIMAVLFVGSLLGRSNTLMLVFAMMAGPFILSGWITFSLLKRTGVNRIVPRRTMAGELVSVVIVLENRKRWFACWLMAASDRIAGAGEQLDASVLFARVPPKDRRNAYYQMRLGRRGEYRFGPIELSTRFPLGLVERGLVFDAEDSILVHPRVGHLTSRWRREVLISSELVQQRTTRAGAYDDDFHRIREYRWGDNPRAIHWRTSARRNELMVKEFHQSRDLALMVALDLWCPKQPEQEDQYRVELAVSFAATICLEHIRQSRDSELLVTSCGDQYTSWTSDTSSASVESLLDTLALLGSGPSLQLEEMVESVLASGPSKRRIIFITTRNLDADDVPILNELRQRTHSSEAGQHVQVFQANDRALQPYFVIDE